MRNLKFALRKGAETLFEAGTNGALGTIFPSSYSERAAKTRRQAPRMRRSAAFLRDY